MPSYAFLWRTSDFSMEVGETVTITLSYLNKGGDSISIWEDGVQIGTTTTNTYEYTPTSAGTHILHYFNTIECSPLTVTVTGRGVSGNDTTTLNGALTELGETLADNLTNMGVTGVDASDGLTTLAEKILDIEQGQDIVTYEPITTSFNYTRLHGGSKGFTVNIPNGVVTIESDCFYFCTGLKDVVIPSSVTSIGERCFYQCTGLTSITLPNNVRSIGERCFSNCTGLTSITLSSSLTSIGGYAFNQCSNLSSIIIPNSVKTISEHCFYQCTGLTSIDIPSSVTSIGAYAFYQTGLTSITLPSSLTSIGGYAFYQTGLTSIDIPSSVTSIGTGCFRNCSKLVDYQLYWETPPVTWSSTLMPNNTDTYFTIPNGTTANYTAKSFPSSKLIERSA